MYWYCTMLWTRRHSSRAHLYDTLNDYHVLQSPILLPMRQRLPDRHHARCCVTFLTYWCCFILEVPRRSQRLDHHFCLVGIFLPFDKFLPYDLLRRQHLLRRRDYLRNGGNTMGQPNHSILCICLSKPGGKRAWRVPCCVRASLIREWRISE